MQTHARNHAGEVGGKREAFSHRRVQNRPSADLQPLAARRSGVWGSREWAVLDSLFAFGFFIRPSLVKTYQKYLTVLWDILARAPSMLKMEMLFIPI